MDSNSIIDNIIFILLVIFIKNALIICEIKDNYEIGTLEEGSYDLLDINDYNNLQLIITTSKNIYQGIPPTLLTSTTANLINATTLITINENFLLAACVQDHLLVKIKLSDGSSSSIADYSLFDDLQLDVPTTSCSLSILNNTIFIGYSKIDYYETETNKTIFLIKFSIKNKDSDDGPDIDDYEEKKYFIFPESVKKTDSSRQISCEPLKITNFKNHNCSDYRLYCIFEAYDLDGSKLRYHTYGTTIKETFDGFESSMKEKSLYRVDDNSGFRFYRLNETYARCIMKKAVYDVYLKIKDSLAIECNYPKPSILNSNPHNSNLDLFDYSNGLVFSSESVNLNEKSIYYFRINNESSNNYFKLYNYKENNIKKIQGYFNKNNINNNILFIYKSPIYIKYFTLYNNPYINDISPYSKVYEILTNEQIIFNFNDIIDLNNIGDIQIEGIVKNISGTISKSYYPKDFNLFLMDNNTFVSEKISSGWFSYSFSFIEQIENDYIKMYYLPSIIITVKTCFNTKCPSCRINYTQCDNCQYEDYALLIDSNEICHQINQLVKGYKYNEISNYFEKCYKSCDFCSEISDDDSNHKCESCANGYLPSYIHLNNCYKINDLQIIEDKTVNNITDESFTSVDICSTNKIESTGECIDECPMSTPYYNYIYKTETEQYEKNNKTAPKYLFNKKCYDLCPSNSFEDDNTNICKCKFAFYMNNEEIICFSDLNCISDYPYQNPDTYECYSSLSDCFSKGNNFFFNNYCYKTQCPDDKIILSSRSEIIKEYCKNNLHLEDELINKICICDITSLVWSNSISNILYSQECLNECPEGFEPETLTNQCIEKVESPTTEIIIKTQPKTTIITTQPKTTIITTQPKTTIITTQPKTTIITTQPKTTIITTQPKTTIITTQPKTTIITTQPKTTIIITQPKTTIIITQPKTTIITTQPKITLITTQPKTTIITTQPKSTMKSTEFGEKNIIKEPVSTIQNKSLTNIHEIYPEEYYNNQNNCLAIYQNKCYPHCPDGTCLTQEDDSLISCIPIPSNAKVFNNICFMNLEEITKNIKSMSEKNEIISNSGGITIRGYSTKSDNEDIDNNSKYSIIYLGDCEDKLKEYYNLSKDTELFILGIDSPNKDKSYTTNVYNYGVYLENGTQLDVSIACKDKKVSISASITNTDLVKLDNASYFSDLGYDIYNESSNFYTDNCAPASIDGNDITLSDRKKDFYPSNVSLCNESCHYTNVNFTSKRFTCECDLNYNYTEDNNNEEKEEDNISYLDYFLSLINYKITVCYELFFDFKSYYYNAGFYIAVGTLVICIIQMFIFFTLGRKSLNKQILDNTPNKNKLIETIKENLEKKKELMLIYMNKTFYPPKKRITKKIKLIKKEIENEEKYHNYNENNNLKNKYRIANKIKTNIQTNQFQKNNLETANALIAVSELRKKKFKTNLKKSLRNDSSKEIIFNNIKFGKRKITKKISLFFQRKNNKTKKKSKKRKIIKDEYGLKKYIIDEQVDKKEYNIIPYEQALRIDNRGFFQIFLSVLVHEIEIINIFYYKSPYNHLSIILSIYIFELCLDLTLNCLLYTDDVVSEKYNNNGSIQFFTTLSLSFMSNIFASIIAFILGKLADYSYILEIMFKDIIKKNQYLLNIIKFKKYLSLKLTGFFLIQMIINFCMCYYLMIFCTVYHKTQGSIMINYIVGIAESMTISLGLAIITSLLRLLSLKNRWKTIYYTSKYFFENF